MKIPESTHEALSRQIKENNWAKILDTLPDGIMILDNHHRVVHVNRAMARLKGLDPGLMVNKYCYEIVHGTSYPLECCPHSKLMADGCEHHAEVHEHLLGGYCMVSVSPICCPEDRLIGSIHVMRDINASKLAQEAIKRSEEKYRLLTENAKEMILSVNMEAIITYANRAALEISGYSSKEVIGRSLIDIIPQDQLELYEQLKQERLSGNKEMFFYETAFKNKKGDIVPVEVSSGPLTKHDQPCGVLISARDITQRKLIEDKLRESEDKYRHLVENISVGILMSQDMKVVFANQKICDFLGYSSKEMLAHESPFDIIHPDDRDMVLENYIRRLKGEEFEQTYPFRVIDKQGETKWVESTNTTTLWQDRPASLNFFVDITERVKSRERQKYLEKRLVQAQKLEAVGILAGGIAHDFNNLLSIILGNIELAQIKNNMGQDVSELFRTAKDMCQNARELTLQLITFSKGGIPVRKKGSVKDFIPLILKERHDDPNIVYRVYIDKDLWTTAFDKRQMKQAFNNLIDNASDAMPDGGIIEICARNIETERVADVGFPDQADDCMIKIDIKDHGRGIPEEHMGKIFDPYFSTKPMGARKGIGLGLTIAYSIVKQHKGCVFVKSVVGKGSTFSVYLPVVKQG